MGTFYGKRIRSGKMTLEEVPTYWKKATEKWLKEHPEAQTESVDAEAAAENAVSAEPVEDSGVAAASKATEKSATATTPKATATPAPTATTEHAETPARRQQQQLNRKKKIQKLHRMRQMP